MTGVSREIRSPEWQLLFDKAEVIHLNASRSDHAPIILHFVLDHGQAPRPFRFLEAWTRDPTCELGSAMLGMKTIEAVGVSL